MVKAKPRHIGARVASDLADSFDRIRGNRTKTECLEEALKFWVAGANNIDRTASARVVNDVREHIRQILDDLRDVIALHHSALKLVDFDTNKVQMKLSKKIEIDPVKLSSLLRFTDLDSEHE
jgi:hypothetical protein